MVFKRTYYPRLSTGIDTIVRMLSVALFLLVASASIAQQALAQMIQIISPSNGFVSDLHSQGVTAKGWVGFDAELWVNGSLAKKGTIRRDGLIDFINVNVPSGDVHYEARLVNPDSSPIETDTMRIHILGEPASIKMEIADEQLRANGISTTKGRVKVLDYWGYALQENVIVTVTVDSGTIITPDINPEMPGTQIRIVNGLAEFEYQAGKSIGVASISAQVQEVKATQKLQLTMPLEPFSLVGLIDGSASSMKASGDLTRLADQSSFPSGLTGDGRIAAYARGTISDDYLLTASYDSDRRNRSRLFKDLDPDYLYSMYGDNSMLYYDVQTQSPLFAKIEKNHSYALIGDYNSDLSSQEFTRYDRALNGIKVEQQDSKWKIKAFGSLTDKQVKHIEIRGEGLSGFYDLQSTQITPGSESVRIETRDRYHSEIVLQSIDKSRVSDYEIDYDGGTLFFKQPIPAFDSDGNPVWIVSTYEAMSNHSSTYIAGASVEHKLMDNLSVGVTGVTEEQSPKNYYLYGVNTKYQFGGLFGVSGEIARSTDFSSSGEMNSGLAYKMEVTSSPVRNLSLSSYYRRMEEGFYNIRESGFSGSDRNKERGSIKYGVSGGYQVGSDTKITSEYYEVLQPVNLGQSKLTSFTGTLEQHFTNRLIANLHVEDLGYTTSDSVTSTVQHSTVASAGATYVADNKLKITAQREQNLSSSQSTVKPNGSALQADYHMNNNIDLSAEERVFDGGGNLATIGLNSTVMAGTQAYSKYEIGNSIAGRRNMVSIGLRNTVKLPYDLTMNLGYERAKDLSQRVDQTPTNDHVSYSAGFEYLPKEPIKASTKIEYGQSNTSNKINYYVAGDYRFQRDFSFILKYDLSKENLLAPNSGYHDLSHLILGLAYRPTESDVINAIGKLEVKNDDNHTTTPILDNGAVIGSIHTYIEPVKRFELGIKVAYKVATDNSDLFSVTTHTIFYLVRGTYDITNKFDVGMEYRSLKQMEANDNLYGYSADVGYAVMTNLKLVVGYNFKGYKDVDLVENNVWSAGPFVKFSYKFGEELFGK